jgi:hypothetical protein
MKKEDNSQIFIILILIASFAYITINETPKTDILLSPISLTYPSDCSSTSISAFWDSIFYETSNGITIYSNSTNYVVPTAPNLVQNISNYTFERNSTWNVAFEAYKFLLKFTDPVA